MDQNPLLFSCVLNSTAVDLQIITKRREKGDRKKKMVRRVTPEQKIQMDFLLSSLQLLHFPKLFLLPLMVSSSSSNNNNMPSFPSLLEKNTHGTQRVSQYRR